MKNSICDICRKKRFQQEAILSEIAYSKNQTIINLFQQLREKSDSPLKEAVMEYTDRRVEEEGKKYPDLSPESELRNNFRSKAQPKDLERCFENFIKQGDMIVQDNKVKITRKGAFKVANLVKLSLENLNREKSGSHKIKKSGLGMKRALYSRKYEFGDTLQHVDMEKTLFQSLKRNIEESGKSVISLLPEDFFVYEQIYEARMCTALLIDESGSMGDEKRATAIDMCLALGKLKKPDDFLKVFVYASDVKEIPFWEILNTTTAGGTTDMKSALESARKSLRKEQGDKQIYMITDAEPNTEGGQYIGFKKALAGVKKEAMICRRNNITINMIMLDDNSKLKMFAGHLARINTGRIFFASSSNSREVVMRDFLSKG